MSEKIKQPTDGFSKFVFILGIIVLVASVVYFGINSKPTEMGLGLVAGALIMAFGNLEKLKSFSGAGFSLELSEKVEHVEVSLETLNELVQILFVPTVTNMAWLNRWGHPNHVDTLKSRDEIIAFMKKQNIKHPEIDSAIEVLNKHMLNDHFSRLFEFSRKIQPSNTFTEAEKSEMVAMIESKRPDVMTFDLSGFKKKYANLLKENPEFNDLLEDFEYFKKRKNFRRPDSIFEE